MGYDKNTRKNVKRLKKRGRFIETEIEETLQDFLPFKPIINDVEHNKKVFGLALYELLPYKADICVIVKLFRKHFSKKLDDNDDVREYLSLVLPLLKQHFSKLKIPSFLNKNFKLLREYFGLSELETQALMFFSVVEDNSLLDKKCTYNEVLSFLSSFFCTKRSEMRRILSPQGKLRSFGFLESNSRFQFEPTSFADDILSEPLSKKEIVSRIARICPKSKLEYGDFAYMKKDLDMLLNYCKNSTNPSIFLYGKPGVGKNEITALLAKELNKELWEITDIDENGESKRDKEERFFIAQKLLDAQKHMVLLDECEDIFSRYNDFLVRASLKKNYINKLLESVKIPSIFLSNSADIDPAFLRRFDIVLEITAPPKDKKKAIVEKSLKAKRISLDSHIITQISESSLSQGVLLNACKVAKTLAQHSTHRAKERKATITESFVQVLNEHLKLSGAKAITLTKEQPLPYDMSLINASMDMKVLCEQIKNISKSESGHKQSVRILAYGMAGSGKSEFAKALAKELDKPIILKRGSDLLSMYVGGTEKNIAKAFMEASKQEAILVFDEVDSFLQDRSGAYMSWEVTQVNEMLTQMESFNGILSLRQTLWII
ncbi:ATP-binding protein [Helicobacter sp. MIT 05-5293]|uniref:ATP-binding protein n=1 Tax=Helicobacter sp. MIT 05-5293 TaxID=1548149 RepID=UPI000A7C10B5|nr:ATP-binding protein [Helicobacter sp. MIT 05-5293]